jgi:hypothetical protein
LIERKVNPKSKGRREDLGNSIRSTREKNVNRIPKIFGDKI